jgi:hypothetical protein
MSINLQICPECLLSFNNLTKWNVKYCPECRKNMYTIKLKRLNNKFKRSKQKEIQRNKLQVEKLSDRYLRKIIRKKDPTLKGKPISIELIEKQRQSILTYRKNKIAPKIKNKIIPKIKVKLTKSCKFCNMKFTPLTSKHIYCSPHCSKQVKNIKLSIKMKKNCKENNAAHILKLAKINSIGNTKLSIKNIPKEIITLNVKLIILRNTLNFCLKDQIITYRKERKKEKRKIDYKTRINHITAYRKLWYQRNKKRLKQERRERLNLT